MHDKTTETPRISVLVPVYKTAQYIARCARSLFSQTFDDTEFIFIDDCSPDDSITILRRTIEECRMNDRVKIVRHERNRGSATTRNTALNIARGEYLLFADSDDYFETDMLERMYATAANDGSDIVWTDFYKKYPRKTLYIRQKGEENPKTCVQALLSGQLTGVTWNKLIKKSLFDRNGIRFPDGENMWEDVATTVRLFFFARRVSYLPAAFCHYNQCNVSSYTKNVTAATLGNMQACVRLLENFLRENGAAGIADRELCYMKLTVKHYLLRHASPNDRKEYAGQYPEATPFIRSYAALSPGYRTALWLASHKRIRLSGLVYALLDRVRKIICRS